MITKISLLEGASPAIGLGRAVLRPVLTSLSAVANINRMAFQTLSRDQAFRPGVDLWIATEPGASWAARRVDWRLNFMVARALARGRSAPPTELNEITERCEIEVPVVPDMSSEPLLVESSRHLPNRAVVVVAWAQDGRDWCARAKRAWTSLGSPGVRVFLPPGVSHAVFEREWGVVAESAAPPNEVQTVVDSEFGTN